ncbi:MAG: glutamine-hydrolyzing GMP synthase [Patescibacteria group bacterium]|jgi:GMP synthase (glutamine-hydrolysing)
MKPSQIAIIDFGSQYTHLITRRIRQLGVLAKIFPPLVSTQELKGVRGIILSGGPNSVYDQTAVRYNPQLFKLEVPILGLCYGHQLVAQHLGGKVQKGRVKEYGFANLEKIVDGRILAGVPKQSRIWMSHGDSVVQLPPGFINCAKTSDCNVAAMACASKNIYGLQFHPEVAHTKAGQLVLSNFVFKICHCQKDWSLEKYFSQMVKKVKAVVGKRNVFLLVSGGVDSTVCFALLEKILGKNRVFGLHIDSGSMRLNESAQVKTALAQAGFGNLHVYDASAKFLAALKGVVDPEKKREIIGRTFLQIKDEVMKKNGLKPKDWVLGQGTIYPDTIETGGTKHADKIKTHHNRVKEILKLMRLGALVEPLSELYKDEVRQVAKKLGLPASLINRHPFPGPGLFIRVLCSSGQEIKKSKNQKINLQRIVGQKLKSIILPLKSVGVQGDNRTYRQPVLLSGSLDWNKLHDFSIRITNEVHEINRVVYLVAPAKVKLSNLKVKKAYLTKDRLDLLRRVDALVNEEIKKAKIYNDIWQFPVVLAPLGLKGGQTIILRPVESQEAMTVNFYQMNKKVLDKIAKKILQIPGIDLVLYDVTNKPPATIEWE